MLGKCWRVDGSFGRVRHWATKSCPKFAYSRGWRGLRQVEEKGQDVLLAPTGGQDAAISKDSE